MFVAFPNFHPMRFKPSQMLFDITFFAARVDCVNNI